MALTNDHINTEQPPYKAVVFDVGEVLIDWNPRYLYRKVFDDEARMEFFLSHVCHHDWNTRQDAGYPWQDAIAEKILEFPEFEAEIKAYHARWMEMVRGSVDGSVDILYRLKKENWPLYAITNYNHETFEQTKQHYPFLNEFDGAIVSGEEKICKPDPRIYHLLFDRYDLKPETCIFIDDRQDNIDAAKNEGMTGLLFQNATQMKQDLIALIGEF